MQTTYNSGMRIVFAFFMLLSCAVDAQTVPDAFEITQRFADSGAPHLALARVEQMQPAAASAPRWADWEQLRCTLLSTLARHTELVRRVAALPATADAKVWRICGLRGARAALALGEAASARQLLARAIWREGMAADDLRQARLAVIDTYVAEDKTQDAYALMLRYQQDYKPVDRDTAARFVDALLAGGMQKEAVNWFSQLDDASYVKLLVRLKTQLAAPDAVIAQARAALAKSNEPGYWIVIRQAGAAQNNRVVQAEALENLLQLAAELPAGRVNSLADELWKTYAAAAQDVANANSLLVGDDGGWADLAARRGNANPVEGRALFAYLAQNSKVGASRQSAQLQLAYSLQSAKLAATAIRLFGDASRLPVAELDLQARYLLGSMAADSGRPLAAARYWENLAAPATADPDEWRVRVASVLVRAGAADSAMDSLRAVVTGRKTLRPELMQRAVSIGRQLHDGGFEKHAAELYRALLPLAAGRERREILSGLAGAAQGTGDFQRAAALYLESALTGDAQTDALALNARLHAATSLARAGLKDDARAQFEWLAKNVRDAEKLETIKRELSGL